MRKSTHIIACLFVFVVISVNSVVGQESLATIKQVASVGGSSGNVAFVTQVGQNNAVEVMQQGNSNLVMSQQSGSSNEFISNQSGDRNKIINTSIGKANEVSNVQSGDDNKIIEFTGGRDNKVSIEQQGDNNIASSTTVGSNYDISIKQDGDNNKVWGLHLGNAQGGADQPTQIIQNGDGNELYTELNGERVLTIKQRNGASASVKQY